MSNLDTFLALSVDDAPETVTAELCSAQMEPLAPIAGYSTLEFGRDALTGGAGAIEFDPDSDAADILITAHPDESHFVVIETSSGYRWAGKCSEPSLRKRGGSTVVAVELDDIWHIPASVLCYRDPNAALSAQPKDKVVTASTPCVTLARQVLSDNLARIAASTPGFPVVLLPPAAGFDTSADVVVELDNQTFESTFADAFKQAGVFMHASLWLPGDPEPPGGAPSGPSILVDIVNHNAFSGFEDASAGDPFTQYRAILDGSGFEAQPWLQANASGDIVDPWVVIDLDGPGVDDWELKISRATAHTVTWAGRRKLYDEERARQLATQYVRSESGFIRSSVYNAGTFVDSLDWDSVRVLDDDGEGAVTVVDYTGSSQVQYDRAITSLSAVTEEVIPGAALVMSSLADPTRRERMGPFSVPEVYITGGEDAEDAVVAALYEARGKYALTVSFIDGAPHRFGRDLNIGTQAAFQIPGFSKRYYDVCTSAKFVHNESVIGWSVDFGYPELDPPAIDNAKRLKRLEDAKKSKDTEVAL